MLHSPVNATVRIIAAWCFPARARAMQNPDGVRWSRVRQRNHAIGAAREKSQPTKAVETESRIDTASLPRQQGREVGKWACGNDEAVEFIRRSGFHFPQDGERVTTRGIYVPSKARRGGWPPRA